MNKISKMSNFALNMLLIIISVAITVLAILNGSIIKSGNDIKVGSVTDQKYKATRNVENEFATEKLKREASKAVSSSYKRDEVVEESVYNNINTFFKKLDTYRIEYKQKLLQNTAENPNPNPNPNFSSLSTVLPIDLSDKLKSTAVSLTDDEYGNFKIDVIKIVKKIFDMEIKSGSSNYNQEMVSEETKKEIREEVRITFDTIESQNLANEIILSYMKPNMFYDAEATEKYRKEFADAVEPVIILENQTIIDEGEIITEEVYAVLDSLGLVQKGSDDIAWIILGFTCLLLVVFGLILYFLSNFTAVHIMKPQEKTLLFTIYNMCVFFIWILKDYPVYVFPIVIFTMLIAILIDSNLAVLMNISFVTLAYMIAKLDFDYYIYFVLVGIVVAFMSRLFTQRSKIISIGVIISFSQIIIFLGINLISSKEINEEILKTAAIIFFYSIISVIFVIGSLPFWEATFGVVTTIKLLDLTNPANPVLKRLTVEAPGTYHHSLIVANLAEAAAIDIGANPILARVGGYYHDIGKLKYPGYFYENQVSENPHDVMNPYDSVEVIKSHVTYGQELVDFYKLPNVINDMVTMHHGNTLIKFFYSKAKEKSDSVNEEDFRYKNSIPQYKEAAILMLADTVEAAVRSLIPSGKSMQEVEVFVRKLVNDKLNDGQLLDSNLTIKDIEIIIKSFLRVFRGMYHERIMYPTEDKADKKEIEPADILIATEKKEG